MAASKEKRVARRFGADGANDLYLVDGNDADSATFRRFYQEVLEPSFPAAELVQLDDLSSELAGDESGLHCSIVLDGAEPIAGIISEEYSRGVLLLSYLAVRADWRNRGLGSRLIAEVVPRWQDTLRSPLIVAEVEHPKFHGPNAFGDPVARLRMYERMGARLLPIPYFQPALRPDLPRVRGMVLICLGSVPTAVAPDIVAGFLDEYMGACEGEQAVRTDPEYLALRESVTAFPKAVPLWPLSRIDDIAYANGG
jgi:GNAT superfamily N-acetyltransferase